MLLTGIGMLRKHGRMRIILQRSFLYGNERGYGGVDQGNVHTAACIAADELLGTPKQVYSRRVSQYLQISSIGTRYCISPREKIHTCEHHGTSKGRTDASICCQTFQSQVFPTLGVSFQLETIAANCIEIFRSGMESGHVTIASSCVCLPARAFQQLYPTLTIVFLSRSLSSHCYVFLASMILVFRDLNLNLCCEISMCLTTLLSHLSSSSIFYLITTVA